MAPSRPRTPNRRRIVRTAIGIGGLLLALAGWGGGDLDRRALSSGETVASLAPREGTGVVLFYDPADSFSCFGILQEWMSWGSRNPGALSLVFTRPPTEAERRRLAILRVPSYGVLRPALRDRVVPIRTPGEMLFRDGKLVARHTVTNRRIPSPLLRRLRSDVHPPVPPGDPRLKPSHPGVRS